ncbi:uncharacterized protein BP5553_06814 [Venustampulla echinocandica]|uniref:Uncharacterized protein n=1 Tax=Venustampulla echinocandica TaxID=2656787 RepID=A0A370TKZ3_9HELO|nr:uncharacterized protein BP5553_06814 [Venustampulla echinocandica]RDL36202.1 hypothetical protein BP5553_06814 [Venustampulla echinocandica]
MPIITTTSLRLPALYSLENSDNTGGPSIPYLCNEKWHISASTLPIWRTKRNCTVTYTALPLEAPISRLNSLTAYLPSILAPVPSPPLPRIDDLVHYQEQTSDAVQSIHAINTMWPDNPAGWSWVGVGWFLSLIQCEWEIFGYGKLEGGGNWMVMHFRKTWLSPEGLDLFTTGEEKLSAQAYEEIMGLVRKLGNGELEALVGEFERMARD